MYDELIEGDFTLLHPVYRIFNELHGLLGIFLLEYDADDLLLEAFGQAAPVTAAHFQAPDDYLALAREARIPLLDSVKNITR